MNFELVILLFGILLGVFIGVVPMFLHKRGKFSLGQYTPHKIMVLQVVFVIVIFFTSLIINTGLEPPRWNTTAPDWTPTETRKHWLELAIIAGWAYFPLTYIASFITGIGSKMSHKEAKLYKIIWPISGIVCLLAWMFAHLIYGCAIHDSCL